MITRFRPRFSIPVALGVSAVCALLVSAWIGPTPSAKAHEHDKAGGCNGTLLKMYPLKLIDGTTFANLKVYYEGGGVNCAATVSTPAYGGSPKQMAVWLCPHPASDPYRCNRERKIDEGDYKWYAGPVRVHALHTCISGGGASTRGTYLDSVTFSRQHCG